MENWRCVCGTLNDSHKMSCWHCGKEREFCMGAAQALAVAREMNWLERRLRFQTELTTAAHHAAVVHWEGQRAACDEIDALHDTLDCGHEARFLVKGQDGVERCIACQNVALRNELSYRRIKGWRDGVK